MVVLVLRTASSSFGRFHQCTCVVAKGLPLKFCCERRKRSNLHQVRRFSDDKNQDLSSVAGVDYLGDLPMRRTSKLDAEQCKTSLCWEDRGIPLIADFSSQDGSDVFALIGPPDDKVYIGFCRVNH